MESLKEFLESKKIKISIRNFDSQNVISLCEIKTIIENIDILENICAKFALKGLNNLDDYYSYLFFLKLSKMKEIIPDLLHDEHKNLFARLSNDAEKAISGIKSTEVIQFINQNYRDIFDKETKEYDEQWFVTIDIIAQYRRGIEKNTFEFLCNNFNYLLIDRFDMFDKTLEQYPDLFDSIYSTEHLDDIVSYRLETSMNFWRNIKNKGKSNLKEKVEKQIEVFSEYIQKMIETATPNNSIQVEIIARKFHSFLERIKSPKANKFAKYLKAASDNCSEDIKEHGAFFQYKIDVDKMINDWKKIKDWEPRLLYITHDLKIDKNTPSHVSRLSREPEGKKEIFDFCSSNIPTDNYYTMSQQITLSCLSATETSFMIEIIRNRDYLADYLSLVTSAVSFISEYLEAKDDQLQHDVETIFSLLQLISLQFETKNAAMRGICYGAAMLMCAFSEKLLRIFYIWLEKDEYVAIDKITLGNLLRENPTVKEVFEENHLKNLSFFLLRIGENKVGENIRNSLAHLNISSSDLTPFLVAKVLWIFTDILNTIFWYCFKDIADKIKNGEFDNFDSLKDYLSK